VLFWELTEAAEATEATEITKAYKHSDNFSLSSEGRAENDILELSNCRLHCREGA